MAEAMKWNHLPEPGGLYAQNPRLLDHFFYIFQERAAHEEREREKEKKREGSNAGRGGIPRSKRR